MAGDSQLNALRIADPILGKGKTMKRSDVTPADRKAALKKYGNVTYADPANKKYPIDTPGHIRAAWNYINKKANAAKYGGKAGAVKARIVSAWKRKIDKKGPPSLANMSEQQETFDMKKVKDFVIFRAGDYPQGKFTEQILDDIVGGYDPKALHEAPVVIGHMEDY